MFLWDPWQLFLGVNQVDRRAISIQDSSQSLADFGTADWEPLRKGQIKVRWTGVPDEAKTGRDWAWRSDSPPTSKIRNTDKNSTMLTNKVCIRISVTSSIQWQEFRGRMLKMEERSRISYRWQESWRESHGISNHQTAILQASQKNSRKKNDNASKKKTKKTSKSELGIERIAENPIQTHRSSLQFHLFKCDRPKINAN